MIIVGGCYSERCRYPKWDRLFGSGLRAALAVSQISPRSKLYSYASEEFGQDVLATLIATEIQTTLIESNWEGHFEWLHPFEIVDMTTSPEPKFPPIEVSGDVVLRFGMVEGDARVTGRRVVYDPQSPRPEAFEKNGSRAEKLAIIMSRQELVRMMLGSEANPADHRAVERAAVDFRAIYDGSSVSLLLKDGFGGVSLYVGEAPIEIKSYAVESFFKIGSGDVFAAAFAHAWGERGEDLIEAADYAARCLAYFVQGPRLPLPTNAAELPIKSVRGTAPRVRLLGADGLDLGALLLYTASLFESVTESRLGSFERLSGEDLKLPTLVLVGEHSSYSAIEKLARKASTSEINVVYWPRVDFERAKSYFPGAHIVDDYASAVYRVVRGGS